MAEDRVFACNERVGWGFLRSHIPGIPYQEGMWTICREVRGSIVGAFGYTDFTGTSCQMHVAGAGGNWLTRDFLWKAFHVPFEQWGYAVMLAAISSGNDASLNLANRLGFEEFAIVPRAHPDGALVFMRMYRENCRWLSLPRRVYG